MIDKITSVFDNYSGKIKNPFIGTIISVWLIHNWRIPFALFNFDKECTMMDKINFIADYFGKKDFWREMFEIVGYSFLILIFTFFLLAISRVLTDFYYKIIEPRIIVLLDKKAVFTQDDKGYLEKRISSLTKKNEGKDEEIAKMELSANKLLSERSKYEMQVSDDKLKMNSTIEELRRQNQDYIKIVFPMREFIKDFQKIIPHYSNSELNELQKLKHGDQNFTIKNVEFTFRLLKDGLIIDVENKIRVSDNEYNPDELIVATYKITQLGKLLLSYVDTKLRIEF